MEDVEAFFPIASEGQEFIDGGLGEASGLRRVLSLHGELSALSFELLLELLVLVLAVFEPRSNTHEALVELFFPLSRAVAEGADLFLAFEELFAERAQLFFMGGLSLTGFERLLGSF